MLKRIFPILACVALVMCILAVPVSAASITPSGGPVVLYPGQYVTQEAILNDRKVLTFSFPSSYCGMQTIDNNGTQYLSPGATSGTVTQSAPVAGDTMAFGAYWPGGRNTGYYLDASVLDSTLVIQCSADFRLDNLGTDVLVSVLPRGGILYFDENFDIIGALRSNADAFNLGGEIVSSSSDSYFYFDKLDKPYNCKYFVFYLTFDLTVLRVNESESVAVHFNISEPNLRLTVDANYTGYYPPVDNDGDGLPDSNVAVSWLIDVGTAFLAFQIAPGLSLDSLFYLVLVVGVVLWLIRLLS